MSIRVVLFDLDGTLLPLDQDVFVKAYFGRLAAWLAPYGYEPKKLIDSIWAGTAAMVKNEGGTTNEDAFWDRFSTIYGKDTRADEPLFAAFYREDFDKVREVCGFTPDAKRAVDEIRALGITVALATNPIFPAMATERRIAWAGLSPSDFALYTTYENSFHCKPNLAYYKDIISTLNVSPEECLMVGNDVSEDMIAGELGMKVFLLPACLINKENRDLSAYPQGDFSALLSYIKENM